MIEKKSLLRLKGSKKEPETLVKRLGKAVRTGHVPKKQFMRIKQRRWRLPGEIWQ